MSQVEFSQKGSDAYKGTLPMTVDGTDFLVDRLGNDCAPMQRFRELTQNAIEAIVRARQMGLDAGSIWWDVDWQWYDQTGVTKLCIVDDGIGMTGPEQKQYINRLSASGSVQGHDQNFGIGAKIAGVTTNPAGMAYLSWTKGLGTHTWLWKDPKSGRYGLQRLDNGDGTSSDFIEVDDAMKPTDKDGKLLIGDHGTKVTLMGYTYDPGVDNTCKAPGAVTFGGKDKWLARYLNNRYWQLPGGITVRVKTGMESGGDPRKFDSRNVTGMRAYLDNNSVASGTVELSNATATWHILDDGSGSGRAIHDSPMNQMMTVIDSKGHVGAVFQDEVYEQYSGRSGYSLLQRFGVLFGYDRVVINVHPRHPNVQPDTARTQLKINGEPLPWAEWAAEFREHMPKEIAEMMESIVSGNQTEEHKKAIQERLASIADLFKVSRYKPTRNGRITASDETVGGTTSQGTERETSTHHGGGGGGGGRTGNVYAKHKAAQGQATTEVNSLPDINVVWVRVADQTRTPPTLEDRAGSYDQELNLLQINADFRAISDVVERWVTAYERTGTGLSEQALRGEVERAVHEWIEQALTETVIGVLALESSGGDQWMPEQVQQALSEEALTAACLSRYHIDLAVKRQLAQKLGPVAKAS